MADPKQLEILEQGAIHWNKWRDENPRVKINLSGANLRSIDLNKAQLSAAYLIRADLSRANLIEADLSGTDLREAELRGTNLTAANLRSANLSTANLLGAVLHKADLRGADLSRADLRLANLAQTRLSLANCLYTAFSFIDLSKAIDLDKIYHYGPSTIGIETLRLSKGNIPEVFLRGCGLSDWEIESTKLYNPDLSNDEVIDIQNRIFELQKRQPLQISSLFISYSHADSVFVDELEPYLVDRGIRFWRDVHHATAGKLEKVIDRAMRLNPTVLLVLSKDSIQSDWVEHEVADARKLEKELGSDVLCPVALDEEWKKSGSWSQILMDQVKKYNILDFSGWKDDASFKRLFERLVEGLNLFYMK